MRVRAHLNGSTTCEHCGGEVSSGSWKGTHDLSENRYMTIHLRRCETATEEERAYFRAKGRWPKKPRPRKR